MVSDALSSVPVVDHADVSSVLPIPKSEQIDVKRFALVNDRSQGNSRTASTTPQLRDQSKRFTLAYETMDDDELIEALLAVAGERDDVDDVQALAEDEEVREIEKVMKKRDTFRFTLDFGGISALLKDYHEKRASGGVGDSACDDETEMPVVDDVIDAVAEEQSLRTIYRIGKEQDNEKDVEVRVCDSCGAAMLPTGDFCDECGAKKRRHFPMTSGGSRSRLLKTDRPGAFFRGINVHQKTPSNEPATRVYSVPPPIAAPAPPPDAS